MIKATKIILLFAIIIFLNTFSFAQEITKTERADPKNIIKFNLLSPLVSSFNLAYERVINSGTSFQASTFLLSRNSDNTDLIKAFGLFSELRFYLSEHKVAPAGFFVAPYLGYYNFQYNNYNFNANTGTNSFIKQTQNLLSLGVIVGGQWIFKKRVSLDIWGGPAYAIQLNGTQARDGFQGNFIGRLGCTLGFGFR